ncbi:ABC transporter ATP-binding protein [Parachitinimonas caeni]|uniref:ATP-binding cassette domain-containing protein n=1 Tax=Parachitinimonas caeni TaxID=3031301 RepID=A0ABT7DYU7_9NEIS|nr:ATP-binding cassette domain-containing protein [Parachitinimonas caeni]MDK2125242.1 ATP-binding cassette domain-containing protein [Parachitinimonas caeni]
MIEVIKVAKHFETVTGRLRRVKSQVEALKEVSFTAADGEVTGLLGPNGAGKTTLLRILAGVIRADSGSVRIDGHDIEREGAAARRQLGLLGDAKGLYPRLSARENIEYFAKLQGLPDQLAAERSQQLIERLGMSKIADRPALGFSQGERMKTAVARALVHDPQTILLDEPTNGLDILATRAMRGLIQDLRQSGKCVMFSSHLMQEVAALCDRILIIHGGQVVAAGTPSDLLAQSGCDQLEDAFVKLLGTEEGLFG